MLNRVDYKPVPFHSIREMLDLAVADCPDRDAYQFTRGDSDEIVHVTYREFYDITEDLGAALTSCLEKVCNKSVMPHLAPSSTLSLTKSQMRFLSLSDFSSLSGVSDAISLSTAIFRTSVSLISVRIFAGRPSSCATPFSTLWQVRA